VHLVFIDIVVSNIINCTTAMNNNNNISRNNDSGNWGQRQPKAAVASSSLSSAFRLHFSPSQRESRSFSVGGRLNETTAIAFDVDDDDEDRNSSNLSSSRWNAIPATFQLSKEFKRIVRIATVPRRTHQPFSTVCTPFLTLSSSLASSYSNRT
jgi:hypothetical protein